MMFTFGEKSEKELEGVEPQLVSVVRRALELSPVDFSVHDGKRTLEEQRHYVKIGASKTMKSKHLYGLAVDLVPYIAGKLQWDWEAIYKIAAAMKLAAKEQSVRVRWGVVWDRELSRIGNGGKTLKETAALLKHEGLAYNVRHPGTDFPDGPHYEIIRSKS